MDRSRLVIVSLLSFSFLFLQGCADNDTRAESKLPRLGETCDGTAIQNKFIVRYYDGRMEVVSGKSRDEIKESVVIPNIDAVDFVEYDQKISLRDAGPSHDVTRNDLNWVAAPLAQENWGAAEIGADLFWQQNLRGEDVVVAVVDTGVDISHTQLRNQIYNNPGESGTDSRGRNKATNNVDDDDNGYVDDQHGFNFVNSNGDVTDNEGHGTHVSGIIAAQHSDTEIRTGHIQGIAPKAKILPLKFLDTDGGNLSDALLAIDYAVKQGAQVINASWGGSGCSKSLRQKVSDLTKHDVLFVAAAGNEGRNLERFPEYPAAFDLPMQVTVGALGTSLYPAGFSNYSSNLVHLFAPGSDIVSTVPGGKMPMDGTSMAAPFISGALALLRSAAPQKSTAEVRSLLLKSVITDNSYMATTHGRLYLPKALTAL